MPSEEDANTARQQHGSALLLKGVHAVGVERRRGRDGWVVVAHVAPEKSVNLPSSLPSSSDKGTVEVPLVVRRSKPFALE